MAGDARKADEMIENRGIEHFPTAVPRTAETSTLDFRVSFFYFSLCPADVSLLMEKYRRQ